METVTGRDFGRLEGKVDLILRDVADMKHNRENIHTDFENRIRGLERWRWGIPATLLGTILTFLVMNIPIA